MAKTSNRFTAEVAEKIKYPNEDGEYGEWDCLTPYQREFLKDWAEYTETLERLIHLIFFDE